MASTVIMMVGGAAINALAFSGSNFLFSKIGSHSDEERKRHDKAIEKLEAAQVEWNKKRTERLDFINEQLKKEQHSMIEFNNADQAMKEYFYITGKKLPDLPPKPILSDFYIPSEDQKNREILFIVGGMVLTGFIAWKLK